MPIKGVKPRHGRVVREGDKMPKPSMKLKKGWYRFTMDDGSGMRSFKGRVLGKTKKFYIVETDCGYTTTVHRYAVGLDVQAVSV